MRKTIFTAAAVLVLALSVSMPSQAAVNAPVAVPGSGLAGFATPQVVLNQAAPGNFINLDPVTGPHDFVSVDRVGGLSSKRLFETSLETGPAVQAIVFNTTLEPGDYEFFCTAHPENMRGTATVV